MSAPRTSRDAASTLANHDLPGDARRRPASLWQIAANRPANPICRKDPPRSARRLQSIEVLRRAAQTGWRLLRDQIVGPLIEGLLPAPCPGCREPLPGINRGGLCDRCWRGIARVVPPLCTRCGTPFPPALDRLAPTHDGPCAPCSARPPAYDAARCALIYEGAVRALLQLFKFDHRPDLARYLAPEIVRALPKDAAFDLIVPVPLHWTRRLTRGYNQAAVLARRVGRETHTPFAQILRKRRRTRDQATLGADARRRNLKGAFTLARGAVRMQSHPDLASGGEGSAGSRRDDPPVLAPIPSVAHETLGVPPSGLWGSRLRWRSAGGNGIQGARVLLIDDILTTGSTAEECARVLKAAGAASVFVAAVARTPLRDRS